MPDDPASRTHSSRKLSCDILFRTYSDAKLAILFLENDFPIVLFKKMLDVILDPAFKPEEVTFEDIWDIFGYVSARRRKDAVKRESALITAGGTGTLTAVSPPTPSPTPSPSLGPDQDDNAVTVTVMEAEAEVVVQTQIRTPCPGVVPPLVLDLVVERLITDRVPLGVAATDPWWLSAFQSNVEPFNNMALVHRSWASIAQRGLRQRVVVPYTHIDKFLLSPFCGPWINEMIIYWSVENGCIGVTKGDIWLLEALLEKTPNLRSLAFNTFLVWPAGFPRPRFDVDICLEIISDLLPGLECLWLRHSPVSIPQLEETLETCLDVRSLCRQLPKLRSLKFLSIHSWGGEETMQTPDELDWDIHPPPKLKTIELSLSESLPQVDLAWLLKPRDKYRLQSLSMTAQSCQLQDRSQPPNSFRETLLDCVPGLTNLRICITGDPKQSHTDVGDPSYPFYPDLLLNATRLRSLDILVIADIISNFDITAVALPPSLKRLAIHLYNAELRKHYSTPSGLKRTPMPVVRAIRALLNALPRLRTLLITGSQGLCVETIRYWDMDDFVHQAVTESAPFREGIPKELSAVCRDRGVDVSILINDSPYRRWETSLGLES